MPGYALGHDEVVLLPGTVDTGGTEYDKGELQWVQPFQVALCTEFAHAVCRVRFGPVCKFDGLVNGFLLGNFRSLAIPLGDGLYRCLVNGSEHTERTDEDKALGHHISFLQSLYEVDGTLSVGAVEVFHLQALCGSGGMDDEVPLATHLLPVCRQLALEFLLVAQVQLGELYALVGKITLGTGATHACPHLVSLLQSFAHDITANETTGSCYQYFFHVDITI